MPKARAARRRIAKALSARLPVVGRLLHVRVGPLHPALRLVQVYKAELSVEPVRVLRRENPAAEALKLGVREDDLHQPLRQPAPAVRLQDEHVRQPREGRVVRHDAREADQLFALINPERQRVLDRAAHDVERAPLSPVTILADVAVNRAEVEPRPLRAYRVFASRPVLTHASITLNGGPAGFL